MKFPSRKSGFTLIELLVVIAILGILAGLAVPALKNLGKSNVSVSASRQLLDDVGRARQLAMSQHTTVYMVFLPTNFWGNTTYNVNTASTTWLNSLTPAQRAIVTNLCDKQLSGYTFMADGAIGDQPGRHLWHYLASWQSLPQGTFIATNKFMPPGSAFSISAFNSGVSIYAFTNRLVPFPAETNANFISMPYIAFNYLGQLTFDGANDADRDEYIPLAQGSILPASDPATKAFQLNAPQVAEVPPGNSMSSAYNIIHIDHLTGRAVLEYQKVQ